MARDEQDDAQYRHWLHERLQAADSAKRPTEDEYARFSQLVHYLRMDLSQPTDYLRLQAWLGQLEGLTIIKARGRLAGREGEQFVVLAGEHQLVARGVPVEGRHAGGGRPGARAVKARRLPLLCSELCCRPSYCG